MKTRLIQKKNEIDSIIHYIFPNGFDLNSESISKEVRSNGNKYSLFFFQRGSKSNVISYIDRASFNVYTIVDVRIDRNKRMVSKVFVTNYISNTECKEVISIEDMKYEIIEIISPHSEKEVFLEILKLL